MNAPSTDNPAPDELALAALSEALRALALRLLDDRTFTNIVRRLARAPDAPTNPNRRLKDLQP